MHIVFSLCFTVEVDICSTIWRSGMLGCGKVQTHEFRHMNLKLKSLSNIDHPLLRTFSVPSSYEVAFSTSRLECGILVIKTRRIEIQLQSLDFSSIAVL